MRTPPPTKNAVPPVHPSLLEQHIAVVVVCWIIVAGLCVIAANAWAMEML